MFLWHVNTFFEYLYDTYRLICDLCLNRNGLLVTCQIDNTSPGGAPWGKSVPGSHKRCNFGHTVIRHFSRDQRIREVLIDSWFLESLVLINSWCLESCQLFWACLLPLNVLYLSSNTESINFWSSPQVWGWWLNSEVSQGKKAFGVGH